MTMPTLSPARATVPAFGANISVQSNATAGDRRDIQLMQTLSSAVDEALFKLPEDSAQLLYRNQVLPEHAERLRYRSVCGDEARTYRALQSVLGEVREGRLGSETLNDAEQVRLSNALTRAMERLLQKTTLDIFV